MRWNAAWVASGALLAFATACTSSTKHVDLGADLAGDLSVGLSVGDAAIGDAALPIVDAEVQDLVNGGDGMVSAAPAPAAAAGYTTQTFNTTKIGTTSGTWQSYNFNGNKEPTGAFVQNSDGSITLTGHSGNTYNADLATGSYAPTKPHKWQGVAFGGGAYFEATFSFTGTPKGYTVPGWPAFWSGDIELASGGYASTVQWPGQATGYDDWIEVDFMEALVASATEYGSGVHNWYGMVGSHDDVSDSVTPVSIGSAKFSSLNRYGCLWVPATKSTQGSLQYFFNDVQVGKTIKWDAYNAALAPPPVLGTSAFGDLDARHLMVILGDSNTGLPMTITRVVVWQASAANNITQ